MAPHRAADATQAVDLPTLIADLSRPEAFPGAPARVEVIQTHISVVFLAGERVYKVKKPVELGFLDYGTPERRRACCEAEVRLNRRLAPGVYLEVAPIVRGPGGRLRVGGEGRPLDHAVVMRRLPDERTFAALLAAGRLEPHLLEALARRVATFHRAARRGPEVSRWARWEVVAGNCRENFAQLQPAVGRTVSAGVLARLEAATEAELGARRGLIEERAARDVACDTHGDLRLEHVYHLPGEDPELVVVDCIEFNERFRYADPVADVAFLVMELHRAGRRDLARAFLDAHGAAAGDAEGRRLLPLYVGYRATVRGKVEGLTLDEPEVPAPAREHALARARGLLLLALSELAPPRERPALLLVGGLPGTGKSTLARALSEAAGLTWIRTDVVRKELAGLPPDASGRAAVGEGIYTRAWTERTYGACLERAEAALFQGGRVVVDGTFVHEARRRPFVEAAQRWGVGCLLLVCEAPPEVARTRLEGRAADASDADLAIYEAQRQAWEEPSGSGAVCVRRVPTGETRKAALEEGLAVLREAGLV